MSSRRASVVATLAIVSLLVAACSGGTPAANTGAGRQPPAQNALAAGTGSQPPAQSAPAQNVPAGGGAPADLCSVWTSDQVSTVVGGPAGSGASQNDGKMCLWGDDSTGANASISLDDSQGYAATCQGLGVLKVDGVADGACYLLGGSLGTILEFKKGAVSYQVAVQKPQVTVDWVETAEKTLALEALSKL